MGLKALLAMVTGVLASGSYARSIFRSQVFKYLAANPALDCQGERRFVVLDSIEVRQTLLGGMDIKTGFFLVQRPLAANYPEALAAESPRPKRAGEALPGGNLYVFSFLSAEGARAAIREFEAFARNEYATAQKMPRVSSLASMSVPKGRPTTPTAPAAVQDLPVQERQPRSS